VVDAAGIIRHAEVLENAGEIPDFQAVRHALESINAGAQGA
jgi:hypothetical protein